MYISHDNMTNYWHPYKFSNRFSNKYEIGHISHKIRIKAKNNNIRTSVKISKALAYIHNELHTKLGVNDLLLVIMAIAGIDFISLGKERDIDFGRLKHLISDGYKIWLCCLIVKATKWCRFYAIIEKDTTDDENLSNRICGAVGVLEIHQL
jgi:hypothetical protein